MTTESQDTNGQETNSAELMLEINLLQNGVDFILKGIDELFDLKEDSDDLELLEPISALGVSPKSYKYGVLHLFSGFLLLLKERLYRHFPEFIFSGKISDIKLKLNQKSQKTLTTIDLDEALERLEIGPRVLFSENEIKVIRRMQDYRNRLEHYQISANKYELWANVSGFLAVIDRFLTQELEINIEETTDSLLLYRKIQRIEVIWQRIETQRIRLREKENKQRLTSFYRNKKQILLDLQVSYRSNKGAIDILIPCPECRRNTMIAHGEFAGVCSNKNCKSVYDMTSCDGCGRITPKTNDYWVLCDSCDDAFHSAMNDDD